jgi:large subunit ribosomal protein L30
VSSLKITQVRSTVSQSYRHEGTLRALGLGKIGRTVELEDSAELRGMLRHVNHLVRIDGKDSSDA